MTEIEFRNALALIMSDEANVRAAREKWSDDCAGMTDDEVAQFAIDGLYSDKLREWLNGAMSFCTVCDLHIGDAVTMSEAVCGAESGLRLGTTLMPKIWPLKAACVSCFADEMSWNDDGLSWAHTYELYIDEAGTVFWVECYLNMLECCGLDSDEAPAVVYRRALRSGERPGRMSLSFLADLLPDEFSDFWES